MKYGLIWGSAVSALALSSAFAQSSESQPVDLGDAPVIEEESRADTAPAPLYEEFDPVDSGTTTIGKSSVEAQKRGDYDASELIVTVPGVQLDINRRAVTDRNVQDIRPSDFTISGGNYYDNNILIDGVGANSIMDVTEDNPSAINEVMGATAQTLYLDPSLVGEITVRDSNVSAEYGDFSGGVVEFETRDPSKEFGVNFSTSVQTDDLVEYEEDDNYEGTVTPSPVFEKYRHSLTVDVPISEATQVLLGYTRSTSEVDYFQSDSYGGQRYQNGDTAENFLFKGVHAFSETLRGDVQVTYSPYESEYENDNRIDDMRISHSDGLAAQANLYGEHGGFDWTTKLSYSLNDASRDWGGKDHFSWASESDYADWCTSSNCSAGGVGDLDQTQEDYALKFSASHPFGEQGEFRFGGEIRNTSVEKTRPNDNYAYLSGVTRAEGDFTTLTCAVDDPACKTDDVVLLRRMNYESYDIDVDVTNETLWGEYETTRGSVTLRGGLRYDYDDFLGNHDLAPRFTATWELHPETFLTFGANRYYSSNMVGYAVRSQYPDSYIYLRDYEVDTSGHATVDEWYLSRHTRSTDYAQADLDTPYSDELTLAFTAATPLDGQVRLKGVYREGKDLFARSPSETVSFDAPTATRTTTRLYTINNKASSEYEGLSAEWNGRYRNHAFGANITWSDTTKTIPNDGDRYDNGDYFTVYDEEEIMELVYYDGKIMTLEDVRAESQAANFATPLLVSANWNSQWFQSRLRTNVLATYKGEYETLDDTGVNIEVDDIRYDVYDVIERGDTVRFNLNAELDVMKSATRGTATVEARINNIFSEVDDTPVSSNSPYQEGRSVWLGLTYTY